MSALPPAQSAAGTAPSYTMNDGTESAHNLVHGCPALAPHGSSPPAVLPSIACNPFGTNLSACSTQSYASGSDNTASSAGRPPVIPTVPSADDGCRGTSTTSPIPPGVAAGVNAGTAGIGLPFTLDPVLQCLRYHDVILGPSNESRVAANPGNIHFNALIVQMAEEFWASDVSVKMNIKAGIVRCVEASGGRFLRRSDTGTLQRATFREATESVRRRLEWKAKQLRKNREAAAAPSNALSESDSMEFCPRRSARIRTRVALEEEEAEQGPGSALGGGGTSQHATNKRRRKTEVTPVPLEKNRHLKSILVKDFLKNEPDAEKAAWRFLDDIFEQEFRPPSVPGTGAALASEAPHNPMNVNINVQRDAYFRNHYGKEAPGDTGNPETEMRYTYGTGSANQSVGICPTHRVTREFGEDLQCIDAAIVKDAKARFVKDSHVIIGPNRTGTLLGMWDGKWQGKDTEQVGMHRDNPTNIAGEFLANNSQAENTPTCVLTLGDTRHLEFRLHKNNFTGDKTGTIEIQKEFARTIVPLSNGSLFYLHPDDEKALLREHFDEVQLSFWKHGKVFFGKDGLSIGIAFRQTTSVQECNKETGQVSELSDADRLKMQQKAGKRMVSALEKYLADTAGKAEDECRVRELYRRIKRVYGKP